MREIIELLIHFVVTLIKLSKPGGVKALIAENNAMRQQLIVMTRGKKRAPPLTTSDRILFGCLVFFVGQKRLRKVAVVIKPTTILAFHKALVKRKYSNLYSNKSKRKTGRKPQDQALNDPNQPPPSDSEGTQSYALGQPFSNRFVVSRYLSS